MSSVFLDEIRREFRTLRQQAERAVVQVGDEAFFAPLDAESNCIAVIVKHVAGNLRSRWTDFLTTDGEKPDRRRDREFVIEPADTRAALMARWDEGWQILLATLDGLSAGDLAKTVRIRGEAHSVTTALLRGLVHTAGHVGQIVLLAKHHAGGSWKTLSIPRGASEAFNRKMQGQS